MKTFKINADFGNTIQKVAQNAKSIATERDVVVEFEFNGVTCLVDSNTDIKLLYRDYSNSWTMGWKQIGPNYLPEYTSDIQSELDRKTKESQIKEDREREAQKVKELKEMDAFIVKTKGIEIDLIEPAIWIEGKDKNPDGYGSAIYEYAESWAKLMQAEIAKGKTIEECASTTSFELGFLGITGFMYGASVSILSKCWRYGEELRQWHNKEYNHEGEGVVNPAIMQIN